MGFMLNFEVYKDRTDYCGSFMIILGVDQHLSSFKGLKFKVNLRRNTATCVHNIVFVLSRCPESDSMNLNCSDPMLLGSDLIEITHVRFLGVVHKLHV